MWRESIIAGFAVDFLNKLKLPSNKSAKSALALYFDIVLIDMIKRNVLKHGKAGATTLLCVCTASTLLFWSLWPATNIYKYRNLGHKAQRDP